LAVVFFVSVETEFRMRRRFQFVCTLGLMVSLAAALGQEQNAQSSASQSSDQSGSTTTGPKNPKDGGSKPAPSADKVQNPARKRRKGRLPAVVHSDQNTTVVPEGGAKEPPAQIAPGLAPDEAKRNRQEAEQWLTATDGQLKELANRHLSEPRQEVVSQVRNYQLGARSALKEGDLRRAHTLALKAHLLADDMIKH
jgi:hypothetical protein